MSENTFDPQEINLQFQPLPAFIDPDGTFKLNTPMLSSFNFDGSIPKFDGNIDAIDIKPGYLIQIEAGGQYYPVVSVEFDDPAIENTDLVTINYIDESGNTVSEEYSETDQVAVVYEDWSEKILGSQGWGITAEGNAIFTNVAVRGRIEATEGEISGNLIVNGGLLTSETAATTGGIVLNNSGFTSYNTSGVQTFNIDADTGTVTIGGYATQSELNGKIDDGGAAGDIVTNNTTITGGNISTGNIKSGGYSGPGTGSAFSSAGMLINLDHGSLAAPNFRIDRDGFAFFKGQVTSTGLIIEGVSASIGYTRYSSGTQASVTDTYSILSSDGKDIFLKAAAGDPAKIRWLDSSSRQRANLGWEVSDDEGGEGTAYPNTLVIRANAVDASPTDTPGQILIHAQGAGSNINLKTGTNGAVTINGEPIETPGTIANRYKNGTDTPNNGNTIKYGTSTTLPTGAAQGDIYLRYV